MNASNQGPSLIKSRSIAIVANGIGIVLVVLGAVTALGWITQSALLVRLIPTYPPMAFTDAIGLILAGAALAFPVRTQTRWIPIALGGALALLGAVELIELLVGADPGIDGLFQIGWLQESRPNIGNMAPGTAFAYLLGGIALASIHYVSSRVPIIAIPVFATVVFTVGLLGVLAYVADLHLLLYWTPYTFMAAHTAIALSLLGVALLSRWHVGPRSATLFSGRHDRRVFITLMVALVSVALTRILISVSILQHKSEEDMRRYLGLALQQRMDIYQDMLRQGISSAGAIASRPGIRRELARLRTSPNHPEALDFINKAIPSFIDLGFGAISLHDAHNRRVAYAGRFANEPQLRIPIKLSQGAELIWSDGLALLRIEGTLRDERGALGTLITEAPLPLFSRMFDNIGGLGETAEMTVCATLADTVRCLPTRLRPYVFSLPQQQRVQPLPIMSALDGFTGVSVNAVDASGKRLIAAYGPVPLTGLGMVVSIRAEESYASILEQFQRALILTGLVVIGALALIWGYMRPVTRALAESDNKLREVGARLRQRDAMLNALMKHTTDAVHFKDTQGRYVLINSAGAQRLDRKAEEILGRDDSALWPDATAQDLFQRDLQMLEKNENRVFEQNVSTPYGERNYVVTQAACRDETGAIVGLVNIARDITDRNEQND